MSLWLPRLTAAGVLLVSAAACGRLDFSLEPVLLAHYGLDEGGGTSARDLSGHAPEATFTAAPSWGPGLRAGAASFDDTLSMRIPDEVTARMADGFTIALWFRRELDPNDHDRLLVRGLDARSSQAYQWVQLRQGPNPYTCARGPYTDLGCEPGLVEGQWRHAGVTWDGDSTTFWVDGAAVATKPAPGPLGEGAQLTVGNTWIGQIDELRIYEGSLPGAALMALGSP